MRKQEGLMYLVFDVGATFIKYALMDDEGNISGKGKTPTDRYAEAGTPAFVAQIKKVYDEKVLDCDITGIAMGLPGQIDVERGIVYGGGGIKYLDGAHLGDLISEACGGVSVALENDGKCAALAELWLGNASTATNAAVVVVGTGIGGGIIIDRKIHRGKRLLAGELSYALMNMTREEADNVRCCEELTVEETFEYNPFMVTSTCTASSITYKASKIMHMKPEEVTGEMVYQWIDEGNQEIIDMVEDSYFSIAKLCCNLYMTIDPDVILIGGGMSANPNFVPGVKKYVDKIRKITKTYDGMVIDICKFRNDSNLLGALYNYKQKYEGVK